MVKFRDRLSIRKQAYAIKFEDQTHNQAGKVSVWLDGALQEQASIPLVSDDRSHEVRVVIA